MKLFVLAFVATLPVGAQAQGLRGDLFSSDGACYLRSYRPSHLATHPAQRVTQIAIGPDAAQTTVATLALQVQVQTRDSYDFYTGVAYCTEGGERLTCSLEGDGGTFDLRARDGAVELAVGAGGMALEGQTGFLQISGTKGDDRVFRLPRVSADSCP